ncbi:MAG: DUF4134 family protein [Bacteroidota bacterium]
MQEKRAQSFFHNTRLLMLVSLILLLSVRVGYGQEDIDVTDDDIPELLDTDVEYSIEGGAFTPLFEPLINITIAIGGLLALFGSIKTYNQWHLGVGNIERRVTNLFGGGLFILVMGLALRAIFL